MFKSIRRRRASAEASSTPFWLWPVGVGVVAVLAGLLLARIQPPDGSLLASLWPGDVESASTVLQVVATAAMTAITLTFSLTVLALQLASQQFSPRLLREFVRDPVTKRVLSVLTAALLFSLTALRDLRPDRPVPSVAAITGLGLGIASLGAIVAFINHMVRVLRVDTMMAAVHRETVTAIEAFYPLHGTPVPTGDDLGLDERDGDLVIADTSGFVQRTYVETLVRCARAHDAVVRAEVRAGDHVVRGTPMATVWRTRRGDAEPEDDLDDLVRRSIRVGYERTLEQDAGFGFRQLEDIAVKAMSPSINDPVTAAHAVGHMADLLVRLAGRRLGPTLHRDDDGAGRAIVPDRDLQYYLDLCCNQLRRVADREPTVLAALLRMLRDVAMACRDDQQREQVWRAAELVADQAATELTAADRETVTDLQARVRAALDGDPRAAYLDRVGETRSI